MKAVDGAWLLLVLPCCIVLGGCGSTIYRLKVPLTDEVPVRAPADPERVKIEDLRSMAERWR